MMRTFVLGALAAAAIGFAVPAQASMANPGLGAAASVNVEQAHYYSHRRHRHRHWRAPYWRDYAYYPRRCWTEHVIRWDGRIRYVRRCR